MPALDSVPVVFRVDKSDGEVIAVFPTLPSDVAGHFVTCYAHVGQHSGCSLAWCRTSTRPASPEQYARLHRELTGIGYKLIVRARLASNRSK